MLLAGRYVLNNLNRTLFRCQDDTVSRLIANMKPCMTKLLTNMVPWSIWCHVHVTRLLSVYVSRLMTADLDAILTDSLIWCQYCQRHICWLADHGAVLTCRLLTIRYWLAVGSWRHISWQFDHALTLSGSRIMFPCFLTIWPLLKTGWQSVHGST